MIELGIPRAAQLFALDAKIKVWKLPSFDANVDEIEDNDYLLTTLSNISDMNCVRWSPNGRYLASCSDDSAVFVHYLHPGSGSGYFGQSVKNVEEWKVSSFERRHSADVVDVTWSPDSSHIASIGHDGKVCIFQVMEGHIPRLQFVREIKAHTSMGKGVAWDPTNRYIASLGDDKKLVIHRADTGQLEFKTSKHYQKAADNMFFKRLNWSSNGAYLVSVAAVESGQSISPMYSRLHDWNSEREFVGHSRPVSVAKFNPNIYVDAATGKNFQVLALGALDGQISLWATNKPRALCLFKGMFGAQVVDLAWSADGRRLLSASTDGKVAYATFKEEEYPTPLTKDQIAGQMEKIYSKINKADEARKAGLSQITIGPSTLQFEEKRKAEREKEQAEREKELEKAKEKKRLMDEKEMPPPQKPAVISSGKLAALESRMPEGAPVSFGVVGNSAPLMPSNPFLVNNTLTASSPTVITLSSRSETVGADGKRRITLVPLGSTGGLQSLAAPPPKSDALAISPVSIASESKKRKRDDDEDDEPSRAKAKKSKDDKDDVILYDEKDPGEENDGADNEAPAVIDEMESVDEEVDDTPRKPKVRKLSNEEALPQFEWAPGSRELLKVKRTLLPLPSSADRKFVKELPEEPSLPEVIVEVTNSNGVIEIRSSKKVDGEQLWSETFENDDATCVLAESEFLAMGSLSGKLRLLDYSGHRLLPDVVLGEGPIAALFCSEPRTALTILSASGELFIWRITFNPFDVQEMFNASIAKLVDENLISSAEQDIEPGVVDTVEVGEDYVPTIAMRSGNVYKFHKGLKQWLLIVDAKAAKSRATGISPPSDGESQNGGASLTTPIATLAQRARESYSLGNLKPSYSAATVFTSTETASKQNAFAEHCKAQMASALLLKSAKDYSYWLRLLVDNLVKKGDEQHLETILAPLCPRDPATLGAADSEGDDSTTILGMEKRELLQSALRVLATKQSLQGLRQRFEKLL